MIAHLARPTIANTAYNCQAKKAPRDVWGHLASSPALPAKTQLPTLQIHSQTLPSSVHRFTSAKPGSLPVHTAQHLAARFFSITNLRRERGADHSRQQHTSTAKSASSPISPSLGRNGQQQKKSPTGAACRVEAMCALQLCLRMPQILSFAGEG